MNISVDILTNAYIHFCLYMYTISDNLKQLNRNEQEVTS